MTALLTLNPQNRIYVDRNPRYFEYVLDFLRNGGDELPANLPASEAEMDRIRAEFDYFCLSDYAFRREQTLAELLSKGDYQLSTLELTTPGAGHNGSDVRQVLMGETHLCVYLGVERQAVHPFAMAPNVGGDATWQYRVEVWELGSDHHFVLDLDRTSSPHCPRLALHGHSLAVARPSGTSDGDTYGTIPAPVCVCDLRSSPTELTHASVRTFAHNNANTGHPFYGNVAINDKYLVASTRDMHRGQHADAFSLETGQVVHRFNSGPVGLMDLRGSLVLFGGGGGDKITVFDCSSSTSEPLCFMHVPGKVRTVQGFSGPSSSPDRIVVSWTSASSTDSPFTAHLCTLFDGDLTPTEERWVDPVSAFLVCPGEGDLDWGSDNALTPCFTSDGLSLAWAHDNVLRVLALGEEGSVKGPVACANMSHLLTQADYERFRPYSGRDRAPVAVWGRKMAVCYSPRTSNTERKPFVQLINAE